MRFSLEHNLIIVRFRYKEDLSISNIVGFDRERMEDSVPVPYDCQDKIAVLQFSEESITAPTE